MTPFHASETWSAIAHTVQLVKTITLWSVGVIGLTAVLVWCLSLYWGLETAGLGDAELVLR